MQAQSKRGRIAIVRLLVRAERPIAQWNDRKALDELIVVPPDFDATFAQ